jgi:hypothetical protein
VTRGILLRSAGIVIAFGGVGVALLYPKTCQFPFSSPSTFTGGCDAHTPLRIGIGVASVIIGMMLMAMASRRKTASV